MSRPNVVSRAEWLLQRKALLEKEKHLTRLRDELSHERQRLPWVALEKRYVFDGPTGKLTLLDLFGERSQLVIYHFMMAPGQKEGCPSCSLVCDHINATLPHLSGRDLAFAAISRAPIEEISPFKERMGWRFPWVSSFGSDFNLDFHVSFSKEEVASGSGHYNYADRGFPNEEAPGLSVFARDEAGTVFHTYSTYARGPEPLLGVYQLLDLSPKGRDEQGLPWPMAWVRHHDRYEGKLGCATCC